jgi:hypothetical protein
MGQIDDDFMTCVSSPRLLVDLARDQRRRGDAAARHRLYLAHLLPLQLWWPLHPIAQLLVFIW